MWPLAVTPGNSAAAMAFPTVVKLLLPRLTYRYSPLIVQLLVRAYSAPPPIVQPTREELGLPLQKAPLVRTSESAGGTGIS
jgi:hypothetical protein